jgi:hypothetical protein
VQFSAAIGDAAGDGRGVVPNRERGHEPLAVDQAVVDGELHVRLLGIEGFGQCGEAFELVNDSLHARRPA